MKGNQISVFRHDIGIGGILEQEDTCRCDGTAATTINHGDIEVSAYQRNKTNTEIIYKYYAENVSETQDRVSVIPVCCRDASYYTTGCTCSALVPLGQNSYDTHPGKKLLQLTIPILANSCYNSSMKQLVQFSLHDTDVVAP